MEYIKKIACRLCGQCCYLIDVKTQQPTGKRCKHLIRLKNGTYLCRIYIKRNELLKRGWPVKINGDNYCLNRALSPIDYTGCPWNDKDGKKPIYTIKT